MNVVERVEKTSKKHGIGLIKACKKLKISPNTYYKAFLRAELEAKQAEPENVMDLEIDPRIRTLNEPEFTLAFGGFTVKGNKEKILAVLTSLQ